VVASFQKERDLFGPDDPSPINEVDLVDRDVRWIDECRDGGILVHRMRHELRSFLAPVG